MKKKQKKELIKIIFAFIGTALIYDLIFIAYLLFR